MGVFVIGSTISPLMLISISMTVSPMLGATHDTASPDRLCGPARVIRTVTVRPIQSVAASLCEVSAGIGRFTTVLPDVRPESSWLRRRLAESTRTSTFSPERLLVKPRLDLTLQRLQRHDARGLLLRAHIVGHPLRRQRVGPRRVLEREHAVIPRRSVSDSVSSKSSAVSPGKPTIMSVDSVTPGIASRMRATRSRYSSRVCRRRMA